MGWLLGYVIGSLAAAVVVVRIFEYATSPFLTVLSKKQRKGLFSFLRGRE